MYVSKFVLLYLSMMGVLTSIGRLVRVNDLRLVTIISSRWLLLWWRRRWGWRLSVHKWRVHLDGGGLRRRVWGAEQFRWVVRVEAVDGAITVQVRLPRLRVDQQAAGGHTLHAAHGPHQGWPCEVLLQVSGHVNGALREHWGRGWWRGRRQSGVRTLRPDWLVARALGGKSWGDTACSRIYKSFEFAWN
jgi:hypothetical protein